MANEKGFFEYADNIEDCLNSLGINNGKDFDVKLPGTIIGEDGEKMETPLSVSFNNGEDFTRIDISREKEGGMTITSYTGKGEEGVDVGYDGPVSKEYQPDNFRTEKFE